MHRLEQAEAMADDYYYHRYQCSELLAEKDELRAESVTAFYILTFNAALEDLLLIVTTSISINYCYCYYYSY